MISKWTAHLQDPDEIEVFKRQVLSAKTVLLRLRQIFKEEKDNLESKELSVKVFDEPNWDYRQAYMNGFKACLGLIDKTVDIKESYDR